MGWRRRQRKLQKSHCLLFKHINLNVILILVRENFSPFMLHVGTLLVSPVCGALLRRVEKEYRLITVLSIFRKTIKKFLTSSKKTTLHNKIETEQQ